MKDAQFCDIPIDHGNGEMKNLGGGGLYYKVGMFDRLYYWNGDEWMSSQRDKKNLNKMYKIGVKKYGR